MSQCNTSIEIVSEFKYSKESSKFKDDLIGHQSSTAQFRKTDLEINNLYILPCNQECILSPCIMFQKMETNILESQLHLEFFKNLAQNSRACSHGRISSKKLWPQQLELLTKVTTRVTDLLPQHIFSASYSIPTSG